MEKKHRDNRFLDRGRTERKQSRAEPLELLDGRHVEARRPGELADRERHRRQPAVEAGGDFVMQLLARAQRLPSRQLDREATQPYGVAATRSARSSLVR